MIEEFEAIGLHIPDQHKLARNIARRDVPAVRTAPGLDTLGCFTESSGARVLVAEKGDAVELWPALRSEAAPRIANITLVTPFVALVDVFDDQLALTHRLVAGVEDPFRFEIGETAGVKEARFSAIAVDVTSFSSEDGYSGPVPFGASFISAPDLFALAEGSVEQQDLTPYVTMGVTAPELEERTNELNGATTYIGTVSENLPVTFALPASLETAPGQWLWGAWKLMVSLGSWD
ncbi:hypothetical protein CKALI_03370 [Corynebacterium kalinowskii]|uniref:Uncharacterized protein n=1 Tax=Corynebacterium kalinowskii TaxID=2675216 RepID=A0A6B8VPR3_9CORY|nr:hypothetical protein [Corynebacterium kalinowskii]QGU01557.1 hypothetical protein CKALI_03370 [Corynebacterium kalinowskii]